MVGCVITSCDIMYATWTYILIGVGVDVNRNCTPYYNCLYYGIPFRFLDQFHITFPLEKYCPHLTFEQCTLVYANLQSQVIFLTKLTQYLFAATYYELNYHCFKRTDLMLNMLGYSCLLLPMLLQVTGKSLIWYTEVLRNLEVNLRPGEFNPVHGGEAGVRQLGFIQRSWNQRTCLF